MLLNFKEPTSPLEKWVIAVCQATTPSGTECSRDFQLKGLQGPELTEGVQSRGSELKASITETPLQSHHWGWKG